MENFTEFVAAVRTQMVPEARANATASTLEQIIKYVPAELTLRDLADAWSYLASQGANNDDPRIAGRRKTCGELAKIADQFTEGIGIDATNATTIDAWRIWRDTFAYSDDPRQKAMAETFDRELNELTA